MRRRAPKGGSRCGSRSCASASCSNSGAARPRCCAPTSPSGPATTRRCDASPRSCFEKGGPPSSPTCSSSRRTSWPTRDSSSASAAALGRARARLRRGRALERASRHGQCVGAGRGPRAHGGGARRAWLPARFAAGEPAVAAGWFDRRLSHDGGRSARRGRRGLLATAYLAAGQRHRAISAVSSARSTSSRAPTCCARAWPELVSRGGEVREPLARVLAEGCEHTEDEALVLVVAQRAGGDLRAPRLPAAPSPSSSVRCGSFAARRGTAARPRRRARGVWSSRRGARRAAPARRAGRDGARAASAGSPPAPRARSPLRAQGDLAARALGTSLELGVLDGRVERRHPPPARRGGRGVRRSLERAERAYRALLVRRAETDRRALRRRPFINESFVGPRRHGDPKLRLFGLARKRGQGRGRRAPGLGARHRRQGSGRRRSACNKGCSRAALMTCWAGSSTSGSRRRRVRPRRPTCTPSWPE